MADLQKTDQFLVDRDGTSYYVTQDKLMAELLDTDLMLVNRSDVSYKATGADIKGSLVDPIVITSVTISDTTPEVGDILTCIVELTGGKNPVNAYQWQRNGVDITTTVTGSTGPTEESYTVTDDDIGSTLDCVVTVTDEIGLTATSTFGSPFFTLENDAIIFLVPDVPSLSVKFTGMVTVSVSDIISDAP